MITKGLFTQLAMIFLAVGIGYFYVMPTFNAVGEIQDDIALYKDERTKVDAVNQELRALLDSLEGIPAQDQRKLLTYMPDYVDPLAVSRLLQAIAAQSGVLLDDVSYQEVRFDLIEDQEESGQEELPVPHEFNFAVQGTYEQIKNTLALLERNEFPLEVHHLELGVVEGVFLEADMTIVTYSHLLPEESTFTNNRRN
jgi:hypothetical protein